MKKEAHITSKGQVTVPIEIRKLLRLKQGDKVVFEADGELVTMRRAHKGNAFAKYAGRYRVGQGKSRDEINAELRGE
jgi:AbrB family looped-hinge helix DNA binding protein